MELKILKKRTQNLFGIEQLKPDSKRAINMVDNPRKKAFNIGEHFNTYQVLNLTPLQVLNLTHQTVFTSVKSNTVSIYLPSILYFAGSVFLSLSFLRILKGINQKRRTPGPDKRFIPGEAHTWPSPVNQTYQN